MDEIAQKGIGIKDIETESYERVKGKIIVKELNEKEKSKFKVNKMNNF